MSKIKLPFKLHNQKTNDWIISNFPTNYEEFEYVEPYTSHGSLIYFKNPSKLDVINDQNKNLVDIYRAFRDEPKDFYNKLIKIKSTEDTFKKHYKKYHEVQDEYFETASTELVVNLMSRNHLKKTINTDYTTESWKKSIKTIYSLSNKLKNVYILDKNPLEIFRTFEGQNTLIYYDLPQLYEIKSLKDKNNVIKQEQTGIYDLIKHSKSKIIVSGTQLFFYKTLFADWKLVKNKSGSKLEYLWKNF